MAYGNDIVMFNLNFEINPREVLLIITGSSCRKSMPLIHLIGIKRARDGIIFDGNTDINRLLDSGNIVGKFRAFDQSGALCRDLTIVANVALPLENVLISSKFQEA
jgi:phospholipid/cholesterol/gamma-HCH transport system ATP-binding protein